MRNFPAYIGLGVALLIGLGLFSLGARNLWRAVCSYRWPTAPATVVASSTSTSVSNSGDSHWQDGGSAVMYMAKIQFAYQVGGRDYKTDQIYIGQTAGSGDSSEAELRSFRYPLGQQLTVSYNPSDPSIASVHTGFQAEVLWLPGAGLAFLVPTLLGYLTFRSFFNASIFATAASIFCAVFMTVGAVILFFGARSLLRGWHSTGWPKTPGVIVYGRRDESRTATQTSDDERYVTTTSGHHIVYRFEANGQTHFSNTRRFGQLAAADPNWASQIAKLYPVGREVSVSYDPQNPDLATIEPGVSKEALWGPGAGAAFLLFGLAVLVFGIPMLARSPF